MAGARPWIITAAAFLSAFAQQPASACSFDLRNDGRDDVPRVAREAFERSSAIIDAEIVVPNRGGEPARLRPIRVLKGPNLPMFVVAPVGSCDIYLVHPGERVRLVLAGGPDLFTADIFDNGLGFEDPSSTFRFDAELDRLVGVPRPAGTAGLNAEEPPPQ